MFECFTERNAKQAVGEREEANQEVVERVVRALKFVRNQFAEATTGDRGNDSIRR